MSGSDLDFATFYAAAWPRLLRTTYAVAGDRQLAEDAVQVALANAYAAWPRVCRATDPFAYVRKAAVNAALAQRRKAHRRRETTVEVPPEQRVPVGADPVERTTVLGAVRALPPRQRAVVVLRYYEDLSEQQIADVLGCRPGTVKSQASAALATLRGSLADDLEAIDPGAGDRAAAEVAGARTRLRRRAVAGAATLAVLLVVGLVALVRPGDDGRPEPAPPVGGSWRTLAPMPIAPRWMPVVSWTGEEVLVVGGGISPPCPDAAACTEEDVMARDGAAYDPVTDTWRRIADAPVDVGYWYRSAFVAGRLVLFGDDRWWSYDPATDTWADLPEPGKRVRDTGELAVSADGFVYALGRDRARALWVLNVERQSWARVPLGSPDWFVRSTVVVTGTRLAFSGERADLPSDTIAVDLGEGRVVETGQGGVFRHWTGERLVELDLDVSGDGVPGGGRLDPATGEWTPLPNAPSLETDRGDGWSPVASDGPRMAGWGYVYDDRAGTWTTLGRPAGVDVDEDQSAVWAGEDLVVVAGSRGDELSSGAWAWQR